MSTVSSVNPLMGAATGSDTTTTALPQQTLGQSDFLKLLAQQFQSQDPLKPMDDTSFIAQMAQFTSLQQSSDMAKDMSSMKAEQEVATANSYLGHNVTVDAGGGKSDSGDVTAIQIVDGAPKLVVNGQPYALSSVLLVQPAITTAPTATSSNPTP